MSYGLEFFSYQLHVWNGTPDAVQCSLVVCQIAVLTSARESERKRRNARSGGASVGRPDYCLSSCERPIRFPSTRTTVASVAGDPSYRPVFILNFFRSCCYLLSLPPSFCLFNHRRCHHKRRNWVKSYLKIGDCVVEKESCVNGRIKPNGLYNEIDSKLSDWLRHYQLERSRAFENRKFLFLRLFPFDRGTLREDEAGRGTCSIWSIPK